MSTHNLFSWRNKKNIYLDNPLIWEYACCCNLDILSYMGNIKPRSVQIYAKCAGFHHMITVPYNMYKYTAAYRHFLAILSHMEDMSINC